VGSAKYLSTSSITEAVVSFQLGLCSFPLPSSVAAFFRFFLGLSSLIDKICSYVILSKKSFCIAAKLQKRKGTRKLSRHYLAARSETGSTDTSRRPFIQLFTVCLLTLINLASSPSLTFFYHHSAQVQLRFIILQFPLAKIESYSDTHNSP
jgi:hypothetical protein